MTNPGDTPESSNGQNHSFPPIDHPGDAPATANTQATEGAPDLPPPPTDTPVYNPQYPTAPPFCPTPQPPQTPAAPPNPEQNYQGPYPQNYPNYQEPYPPAQRYQTPKVDGNFVLALKAILPTLRDLHQGNTLQAIQRNAGLAHWWWVSSLAFSLIAGISFATLTARWPSITASFLPVIGSVTPYSFLSFGYWLMCFFVYTLLVILILLIRVLLVMASAATQRVQYGFKNSASTVGTGLVLPAWALLAMLVIELLPIPLVTPLLVSLLQIFTIGGLFMMELIISTALRTIPGNTRSDVLWHSVFYTLWIVFVTLVLIFGYFPTATTAMVNSGRETIQNGISNMSHNLLEQGLGNMLNSR